MLQYTYVVHSYVRTSALSSRAPTGRATNKNNLKQIKQIKKNPWRARFFLLIFLFVYVFYFFWFFFIFLFFYFFLFVFIFIYVFLVVFMCNYLFLFFLYFFLFFPIFSYFFVFFLIFSYFSTFAGPAQIVTYQIVTSSSELTLTFNNLGLYGVRSCP